MIILKVLTLLRLSLDRKMKDFLYFFIILLILFLFPLNIFAQNVRTLDNDLQVWIASKIEAKITDPWFITVAEESRMGEDAGRLIHQYFDIGIIYKLSKQINFSGNFRYIKRVKDELSEEELRPHFSAIYYWNWFDLDFSNKSCIEYRLIRYTKDKSRYRNETKIRWPAELTRYKINPYIADEIFFDADQDGYNQNRLSLGIEMNLFKYVKGDIYYLWQTSEERGKWFDANIIGTRFSFDF